MNKISYATNLFKTQKKNFGANEKALKARIRSVSSISKITKAMKMVSSSKMRADLARLEGGKEYGHGLVEKYLKNDQYLQRKLQTAAFSRYLYVPFSSDKGLCGGINSNIVREVKSVLKNKPLENSGLYVVGDKGITGLSRSYGSILIKGVHELQTPMNFSTASSIAHDISIEAEKGDFDKIVLVYNVYKSAISSIITKTELYSRKQFLNLMSSSYAYFIDSPDKNTVAPALYDLYVSSNFYRAILNNLAAEQSARMSAMENASKNAKEIVEKLLLQYNKARQARITMELVEIISGASAV